tara:strand:+ start:1987 stop:2538 length:552 start_codon:yes stop_codon:yes gene_type:complete
MWWEILKNAKLSGKATGTSLDASKIKINIDEGKCKEKLIQYSANAQRLEKEPVFYTDTPDASQYKSGKWDAWDALTEEVACKVIKKIDEYFVISPEVIEGLLLEPNFSQLQVDDIEKVDIDNYYLKRAIQTYYGANKRKKVHIGYLLYEKIPKNNFERIVWYVDCFCYKEAGDLSDSELDWRK